MKFKTFLGQEVNVGDYIVYPGRRGGSCWMNVGKVLKIYEVKNFWSHKQEPVMQVLKLRDSSYQNEASKKPSVLTRLDRVVKIDLNLV